MNYFDFSEKGKSPVSFAFEWEVNLVEKNCKSVYDKADKGDTQNLILLL